MMSRFKIEQNVRKGVYSIFEYLQFISGGKFSIWTCPKSQTNVILKKLTRQLLSLKS